MSAVISPSNSKIVFNGIPITGRATGTYFSFVYNTPNQVSTVGGVDGSGYYVVTGDFTATMTVTVQPTSTSNSILSTAFHAFLAAPNGLRAPLLVKQQGTHFSGFGAVAGLAPIDYSDAATPRVWTIVSAQMIGFVATIEPSPLLP